MRREDVKRAVDLGKAVARVHERVAFAMHKALMTWSPDDVDLRGIGHVCGSERAADVALLADIVAPNALPSPA